MPHDAGWPPPLTREEAGVHWRQARCAAASGHNREVGWQGPGQLQRATVDDVDDVVEVLDEVATSMSGRGIAQWPPRFAADWVRPAVEAGETWLVVVDNHQGASFLRRGDAEVRGAPGQRNQAGPRTLVSRYARASPTAASRQVG